MCSWLHEIVTLLGKWWWLVSHHHLLMTLAICPWLQVTSLVSSKVPCESNVIRQMMLLLITWLQMTLLQVTLLQAVIVVVVVSDVTWNHGQMANVISKWWWLTSHHHLLDYVTISWSHEHMAVAIISCNLSTIHNFCTFVDARTNFDVFHSVICDSNNQPLCVRLVL